MKFNWHQELNKEQFLAVKHTNGPSIILAGAGSGKTRVLTYKAMYLLEEENINAQNILMLTFTNKAAHEMKGRILKTIDNKKNPNAITASTFHSFCTRTLRRFGLPGSQNRDFVIFDDRDQLDLIKDLIKSYASNIKVKPSSLLYLISKSKSELKKPSEISILGNELFSEQVSDIYSKYQEKLREIGAVDFDDLILLTISLLKENPHFLNQYHEQFKQILIDEYQDTNHAQYVLAKTLINPNKNVTIVGDFSQSIYSWRGADFNNLKKFQKDFPNSTVFNLEQNYRSTQAILDLAFKTISHNTGHPILKLWTDKTMGEDVEVVPLANAEEEALFVINKIRELNLNGQYGLQEMAILYRTNSQSRLFEEVCLQLGLPYRIFGGVRFYERKEIKDLLAVLRLLLNEKDSISLKRITNLGKNRSKKIINILQKTERNQHPGTLLQELLKTIPYLEIFDEHDPEDTNRLDNIKELVSVASSFTDLIEFLDSVSLIESGYNNTDDGTDKLNLLTLHAAKGLEYSVVFIVGLEEGLLPHSRSLNSWQELEEERRLFYVGITRARDKLFLTFSKKRLNYGRLQYNLPSQFLTEIDLATEDNTFF